MKVPLLDVNAQNLPLQDRFAQKFREIVSSGIFILGPEVEAFEREVAAECGAEHGIGVSSGTDALVVALMTAGVGPGDEVICPAFTFFATAGSVERLGAMPVFVDVLPDTFNIDVVKMEEKITERTAAIIPVHLFGQSADMAAVMEVASRHNLTVIEDVAQAIGAKCGERGCGSIGDFGTFSFYPTKNLGGVGEGGMVTTNDEGLAARARAIRNHGMVERYRHDMIGGNFRLDAIQAGMLRIKLEQLEGYAGARRANAARYQKQFADISELTLPQEGEGLFHTWNQFTVRVAGGKRDELRATLAAADIGSEIYYPITLDQQPCFKDLPPHALGGIEVAHQLARECLSLPVYPELAVVQQDAVIAAVRGFFHS
ncbi:MAG: dTDP-4-amino-4,6-dideoxygalactose transaminase [Pseudoalteromonas tetraodonis]